MEREGAPFMTLQQGLAFGLVALTIVAFVWGRFRYDVIALVALVAGVAVGVIPAKSAFDGFRNDVTVIIACALVVSAAFARSGIVELALRRVLPLLTTEQRQVPVLTLAVTLLSMVTKNVGALAILMPVAQQVAKKTGTSNSRLLMPMAFGAMIGGLVTLVGTAPNIIVAEVRGEILGQPFGMFDYSAVGLPLTALSLVFLAFGYRLLPKDRQSAVAIDAALAAQAYLTELQVPIDWTRERMTVAELNALGEGDVQIMGLLRNGRRKVAPRGNTHVGSGDVLLVQGEPQALEAFVGRTSLSLTRNDRPIVMDSATEEVRVVEVVVSKDSPLVGKTAKSAAIHTEHGVNLLAVSRTGYRLTSKLHMVKLKAGDILLLQGGENNLPGVLQALGCLPLAEREVRLGGARGLYGPAVLLAAAMTGVAFGVVPVAIAFFGAAVGCVVIGGLRMREAYAALDGPLLVLIACLIPVSDAISTTGGSELLGGLLARSLDQMPGLIAVFGVMAVAMAVTPFLNNAATVLIMAPIGASLAAQLEYSPDPLLMAVAVGAACDFLTPIGHQCNTLVMAPGGYKFQDYPRLGAPLSVLVLLAGPPLILLVWPL